MYYNPHNRDTWETSQPLQGTYERLILALQAEREVGEPTIRKMLLHHVRYLYRAHKRGY